MTFLSVLAALLAEHTWPLREDNRLLLWFERYAAAVERALNGGQYRHGMLAWALAAGPALAVTAAIQHSLGEVSLLAELAWSIAVLYATMGFRRVSREFTEVELALRAGELAAARDRLGKWRRGSAAELDAGEAARAAIEQGLLASHRRVFGPIAWFVVLGPAGAVLYRVAAVLSTLWGARDDPDFGAFGRFAARAFHWLDWIPVRLTAATFAAAGDFADAVYCWRAQASGWEPRSDGIILASGGGALGVRLGDTLHQDGGLRSRPELGTGEEPDVEHMPQAAGLVWRALVLWVFLIFVVSLAHALG
jgi:adenosylcobinamide-phosphate synthase